MEILCKSDYQNVYRIMDGVLLVVDKFEYISFENDQYPSVYRRDNKRIWKKYTHGCESGLVELVVKYKKEYMGWEIPKGTVLYNGRPVRIVPRDKWKYKIKTTGSMCSGSFAQMDCVLEEIISLIEELNKEQ